MTVTDLHAALTTLKAALPGLERLAQADAMRADMDAAIEKGTAELNALQARITALQTQAEDGIKAAREAQERLAGDYAKAINLAEEKIKDLQRSQQVAEQQLATTRAQIGREREAQAEAYQRVEQEHADRVAELVRQAGEAAVVLTTTQERIKALHGDLAGMAGKPA